ncbi:MAG: CHAD domain-containing protein [Anaerolineae bacterium]|nr:CHAD domain-containing protein [Thermoflexales bacterium]MDW8407730.1 CHAD domain-containing protein [Anaerolineae bacterium]
MDTIASLCERYRVDLAHADHVARLTVELFDALQRLHRLPPRARDLAEAGAMLHNVGLTVDEPSHHLVGRDIIAAAQLTGFTHAERLMLACITAFHRKTVRPESEQLFQVLNPVQQQETLALSALVRIADGLDYSQTQSTHIDTIELDVSEPTKAIRVRVTGAHSHEDAARAEKKSDLWRALFCPVYVSGRLTSPGLALDHTLAAAGRRILRYHLDQIEPQEWLLAADNPIPPRQIDRLYTTVRYMRATVRAFGEHYRSKRVRPLAKGLSQLEAYLQRVRERDVWMAILEKYGQGLEPDSDLSAGAEALRAAWQAERESAQADLIEYTHGIDHGTWFEAIATFTQSDRDDKTAPLGKPARLRHAVDLIQAAHLARVKAFDELPARPAVEDVRRVYLAVERLRSITDGLRDVLPPAQVERIQTACTAAQETWGIIYDAYTAAHAALRFLDEHAADEATLRGVLAFGESQRRVIDARLPAWRTFLEPLLVI